MVAAVDGPILGREARVVTKPEVITLEEHFTSPKLRALRGEKDTPLQRQLDDLGNLRIRAMDEAGIDLQVISENNPAAQNLDAESAVKLARASNDILHEAVRTHPDRFAGFATLPTPDPGAAADELERAVGKLGFKGAMIMGLTQGRFMDDKQFRPIFERAAALDVPLYVHPTSPHPAVVDAYFKEYPALAVAPLGFTLETLTHTVRLVVSGLFDEYPKLKIIVGHLGETMPYLMWRTDYLVAERMSMPRSFADYYRECFWLTTSGSFSNAALACAIAEMGADRIMFSVDWPFIPNALGRQWLDAAPLSDADRAAILSGNARTLLGL
jgi:predicted TIM-barrel fold metal-dependent hydrolase